MNAVHIHAPQASLRSIDAGNCVDCKKRTRFIGFFTEYYGWDDTCLRCGRRWADGEWMLLPSARHARRDSINAVKIRWRRFVAAPMGQI